MSTKQHYDEDFKRTLVELYHNGKTQASLIKEYGVSQTALSRWVKQYSTVETDDGEVLTAKQVKELQKRMAQLEEENSLSSSSHKSQYLLQALLFRFSTSYKRKSVDS